MNDYLTSARDPMNVPPWGYNREMRYGELCEGMIRLLHNPINNDTGLEEQSQLYFAGSSDIQVIYTIVTNYNYK